MPPRRRKGNKETEDAPFQPQEQKPVEIMDSVEDLDDPSSSEEDHDDDPILKSYDVFISNQLKDHIYLLQYPIRNPDEEYYAQSAPYNARIKPNEGSFDLDVPIDSRNYNFSRGDKFSGSQLDPSIKAEPRTLDRQRLNGKCQSNQANYFVGVFFGDQMHLTPVKRTVQLRPNFNYYDTAVGGERRKKFQSEDGPAKQPRAVHPQMKSLDELRDPRGLGQHDGQPEEFVPLEWVDSLNPDTVVISEQLLSTDTLREFVSSINSRDFLRRLTFKDYMEDTNTVKTE